MVKRLLLSSNLDDECIEAREVRGSSVILREYTIGMVTCISYRCNYEKGVVGAY